MKMLIHSHNSSSQFPPTFQFPFSYESHPNFSLMGEEDGHRHLCLYSRNSVYVGSVAILSVQLTVSSFTVTCIVNTEFTDHVKKGKGSPYSITERRVLELIPVLGSRPAGDVSRKPGGRLP